MSSGASGTDGTYSRGGGTNSGSGRAAGRANGDAAPESMHPPTAANCRPSASAHTSARPTPGVWIVTMTDSAATSTTTTATAVPDRTQRPIFLTTRSNDPKRRSMFSVDLGRAIGKDAVR